MNRCLSAGGEAGRHPKGKKIVGDGVKGLELDGHLELHDQFLFRYLNILEEHI